MDFSKLTQQFKGQAPLVQKQMLAGIIFVVIILTALTWSIIPKNTPQAITPVSRPSTTYVFSAAQRNACLQRSQLFINDLMKIGSAKTGTDRSLAYSEASNIVISGSDAQKLLNEANVQKLDTSDLRYSISAPKMTVYPDSLTGEFTSCIVVTNLGTNIDSSNYVNMRYDKTTNLWKIYSVD